MRSMFVNFATVSLLVVLAGCSSSDLIEVSGEVTLDAQPVEQGTINFWPDNGQGPSAGLILHEGKYRGLVAPGAKKVSIEALKQVGEERLGGPDGMLVPIHKTITPARFSDPKKTELRCEVSPEANVHNFQLTSK